MAKKGRKMSQEHKDKIRMAKIGKRQPNISKALKGRKFSKETLQKMSESAKLRPPNFIGHTHKPETKERIRRKKIGIKMSEESRMKISESTMGKRAGKKNNNWKGDNVSKKGIHSRVSAILGKPRYCEKCKRTDRKRYDWANTNHKYRFDFHEWIRLCRKCHIAYDKIHNGYQSGRKPARQESLDIY